MKNCILAVILSMLVFPFQALAGYDEGLAAARAGDLATALAEWKPLANNGHPEAQYSLGIMYENGEGVAKDPVEAAKWYRKAAEQGHASAQFKLVLLYASGEGVAHDMAEAAKWCRKAAEQRHVMAQLQLGIMYANGFGVDKDRAEAVTWYRKAAEQGDAGAQFNLAGMYWRGDGVKRDIIRALKWHAIAARNGNQLARQEFESGKILYKLNDETIATVMAAAQIFRPKPIKMSVQEETDWLKSYHDAYANAKTSDELRRFIRLYEDDDPDRLVEKARARVADLDAGAAGKKREAGEKK